MDIRLLFYIKDTGVTRIDKRFQQYPDTISSLHTNTCCFASCSFSEIPSGYIVEWPFYDFPIDLDDNKFITLHY